MSDSKHFYLAPNMTPNTRVTIKSNIAHLIESFPCDKKLKITVALDKDGRSSKQNSYLWSGVYPAVRAHYKSEMLTDHIEEVWHEYFKDLFLEPKVSTVKGLQVSIYRSTTKLSASDFCDFIDQICAHVADDGCVIPPPTDPALQILIEREATR